MSHDKVVPSLCVVRYLNDVVYKYSRQHVLPRKSPLEEGECVE